MKKRIQYASGKFDHLYRSILQYIVKVNYLAHAYLSFDQPETLTGNMISDFVKGKKKFDYAPGILVGIDLHRAIDQFTDEHPVTKSAKQVFRPAYGLYCSAFMDVAYDHFLAKELATENNDFMAFTDRVYLQLDQFQGVFPPPFLAMYPYMKKQNWLYNYQFSDGIAKSFAGLVRRAAYLEDSLAANLIFEMNYDQLRSSFQEFFPSLKTFSQETLNRLTSKA